MDERDEKIKLRHGIILAVLMIVSFVGIVCGAACICFKAGEAQAKVIRDEIVRRTQDPEARKSYQKIAIAKDVITITMRHVREMHEKKFLSEETWETLKPLRQEIYSAMDLAQLADNSRNDEAVTQQLKIVEDKRKDYLLKAGISVESVPACQP